MNIDSSYFHNCQKLEVTKISFSRRIDEKTLVHTDSEILFSSKKKCANKSQEDILES